MKQIERPGSWLLLSLLAFLVASPIFSIGGHESVVAITGLGWFPIYAVGVTVGVGILVWAVIASRPQSVDVELASMRRNHPAKWLAKTSVAVLVISVVAAIFSWLWLRILIRQMPATHDVVSARVTRTIRDGSLNPYCRMLIDVQSTTGRRWRICGERGVIRRRIQPGIGELREGDSVTVVLRITALGTSASVVPLRDSAEVDGS